MSGLKLTDVRHKQAFEVTRNFLNQYLVAGRKLKLFRIAPASHHLLYLYNEFKVTFDEAVEETDSRAGGLGCDRIQLP